jgi:hypothetical protein
MQPYRHGQRQDGDFGDSPQKVRTWKSTSPNSHWSMAAARSEGVLPDSKRKCFAVMLGLAVSSLPPYFSRACAGRGSDFEVLELCKIGATQCSAYERFWASRVTCQVSAAQTLAL